TAFFSATPRIFWLESGAVGDLSILFLFYRPFDRDAHSVDFAQARGFAHWASVEGDSRGRNCGGRHGNSRRTNEVTLARRWSLFCFGRRVAVCRQARIHQPGRLYLL